MTGFPEFPANGHAFSADETGQALAGLIRRDVNGLPVPGMLGGGPKLSAVVAAWKVQVGPFAYVRLIGAAVGFSGLSAAEQVDIVSSATIPAGQARIDRVCWDATTSSLVVVTGIPSASPVAPSDGGLVRVLQVRVNAGDGAVIQSKITPDFPKTSLQDSGGKSISGVTGNRPVAPGGVTPVAITFPVGTFDAPPNVQATRMGDARDVTVGFDSVTKDGFILRIGSASVLPRQAGASWRAEEA